MVSLYKGLFAIYLAVGGLCMIFGGVFLHFYPNACVLYLVLLITILSGTIAILTRIAKNRFQRDVMSLLENCYARAYIDELTKLLGKKRGKRFESMYASLSALGYDVLGDYDSLYASCMNIKVKSYMFFYHRRMFTYYLHSKELAEAIAEQDALKTLAASTKNKAVLAQINNFIDECEYALKFNRGDLEGVEEYYTKMLNQEGDIPLISRVSYACALGKVLIAKGRKEEAKTHFEFVSSRGGDSKFKKSADELLAEW